MELPLDLSTYLFILFSIQSEFVNSLFRAIRIQFLDHWFYFHWLFRLVSQPLLASYQFLFVRLIASRRFPLRWLFRRRLLSFGRCIRCSRFGHCFSAKFSVCFVRQMSSNRNENKSFWIVYFFDRQLAMIDDSWSVLNFRRTKLNFSMFLHPEIRSIATDEIWRIP